jgi:hypothetical protein
MAKPHHLSEQERLLQEAAAQAFARSTGMRAVPIDRETRGTQAGADGEMQFDLGGGRRFTMPVEVKANIDRFATTAALKDVQEKRGEPMLLVTDQLSPKMAESLREHQISFLDTAGNVFLDRPEALLYVVGRRLTDARTVLRRRTSSPKQLQVLYALMTTPELVSASYRTIAAKAGVALSTVNMAIDDLLERGLLVAGPEGERSFGDWDRVVEEWGAQYPARLRVKLPAKRYTTDNKSWWQTADLSKYNAAFSGEVAAAKLTHHLRPVRVMLYAPSVMPKELILAERLRADPRGEIEIVQAFWHIRRDEHAGVATPALVYADLLDTGESRNLDMARAIRKDYLEHPPRA